MDTSLHTISNLFEQLGLDGSTSGITDFIKDHSIPAHVAINDAEFWNRSQASFIKDSLQEDGDWSEVVDQLDAMLRQN